MVLSLEGQLKLGLVVALKPLFIHEVAVVWQPGGGVFLGLLDAILWLIF
ncbi:hypothetical protein SLEP1_g39868 [Rubroshorea leprosula]|uniref:Uncharacterized protein n=1 Tax=Rubroshorea leprosula TaxID=152421 RepID=A0AAV5L1L1_9ROSI|nr:hypothetical protein SLEP1_g39868 [Rubroshorea leprosula]